MNTYAIVKVKIKNDNDEKLTEIETKDELARRIVQLEKLGTVERIVVYLNHHTHRLVENWADEMYEEVITKT